MWILFDCTGCVQSQLLQKFRYNFTCGVFHVKHIPIKNVIFSFLWGLVTAFFILISERTLFSFINHTDYFVFGIIFISLIYLLLIILSTKFLLKVSTGWLDIIAIIVVAFTLRILTIKYLNTQPVNDFFWFYNDALRVLAANEVNIDSSMYSNSPELFSYVLWEALILKILGTDAFSIQITNTIACTIMAILIYFLLRKINRQTAIVGGLLFSISPASIVLTPVLTNQHASLLFYLLAYLLVTVERANEKFLSLLLRYFASGILIGIGQLIRPDGIIPLLSILAFLIILSPQISFLQRSNKIFPWVLKIAQPALLGIILCIGYALPINSFITISKVDRARYQYLTTLNTFYKIWVGLNPETRGTWSLEDRQLYDDLSINQSMDQSMLQIKIVLAERIKNIPGLFTLFSDKIDVLWIDNDYSFNWATEDTLSTDEEKILESLPERKRDRIINEKMVWLEDLETLFATFDKVFRVLIYVCAVSSLWVRRNTITRFEILFLIVTTIYFGAHLLIEVQTRYRYFLLPIMVMLASPAVTSIGNKLVSAINQSPKRSNEELS